MVNKMLANEKKCKIRRVEKCLLVINNDNVQANLVEHKTKTITNYDFFYFFKMIFISPLSRYKHLRMH